MRDANDILDDKDTRLLGHVTSNALLGGVAGATTGLLTGGVHPNMLHPVKGRAGAMALAGTALGGGIGYLTAQKEQRMAEEHLKMAKTAAAYFQGRAFASQIQAMAPAQKAAFFKELDNAVGHGVGALAVGAGKLMQGVGHAGKAIEDWAKGDVNHELVGRIAGGAAIAGGTALAIHHLNQAREQDAMIQQQMQGAYGAPGGMPWS